MLYLQVIVFSIFAMAIKSLGENYKTANCSLDVRNCAYVFKTFILVRGVLQVTKMN